MLNSFFITGTGTGVGKTLVTSILCHQLIKKGFKTKALKPVISGFDKNRENDISSLMEAQNLPISVKNVSETSLFRLKQPISPHIAAKNEGIPIDTREIEEFCARNGPKTGGFLFIEGIGGLMTPLNDDSTVLSLIKLLKIPVIVVSGTSLGAFNHILLAIEVAQYHKIQIAGIVVSESEEPAATIEEIKDLLENYTESPIFALPRIEYNEKKWQNAPDLTRLVLGESYERKKVG